MRLVCTRIFDGDNVRHGLNKDLGFTDAAPNRSCRFDQSTVLPDDEVGPAESDASCLM